MISVKTIVRLTGNPANLCPHQWYPVNALQRCRATGSTHVCVGDSWHGGKHVCPCGALRMVYVEL